MIRELRASDRDEWQRLYQGYQAFYNFPDRPAEFYDKAFARLMAQDARDFHGLVHEADGKLLGLTHYVFHPSLLRPEGVCYLQDLFTLPACRGQGIGKALIEAVYSEARRAGACRVYWQTQHHNTAGRALYDKVAEHKGFIVYSHEL